MERDVNMTWREIKWASNSSGGETGQREKSFRQIDGDEGGLEIPPIVITTHDCSDSENGPCVAPCVCFCFLHCLLATMIALEKWP